MLNGLRTVNVPPFPESIAEGDINWRKAVGDAVNEDEIVAEIETDKTTVQVVAPCCGIITDLLVEDGAKVVNDQQLLKIDEKLIAQSKIQQKPTPDITSKSKTDIGLVETITETPKESSPQIAIPAHIVPPVPLPTTPHLLPKTINYSPKILTETFVGNVQRSENRVKLTRLRRRTAQRLKDAQNTCAILTTFNEIDMSNLIDMRNKYKDAFLKKYGVKLGIMSSFGKAAAYALQDQPVVNGFIQDEEIIYRNYIDLSIAIASPKGLVVPVLRNVGPMNFADIEKGIHELSEKAKDGSLAVEDMDGGTFTISNGGVFGSLLSTPIINPPQSAILGLHGTFERPVAIKGEVVIRPMMYVALSYDHRLIDGREAVIFLRKIKSFIEDPRVLFLNL